MKRIAFQLHDTSDRAEFRKAVRQLRAAMKQGWVPLAVDEGVSGGLPAGRFVLTAEKERETISFRLSERSLAGFRSATGMIAELPEGERSLIGAEILGKGKQVKGELHLGEAARVAGRKTRSGAPGASKRAAAGEPTRGFLSAGSPSPSAYDLNEAAAIEALRSGKGREAEEMRALLGPEYFELLGDMARSAAGAGKRGRRAKVLVLPGIMGSKLGTEKKLFGLAPYSDVIWLDPVDMRLGRLADLTLTPDGKPRGGTTSVGVLYSFYLRLKLSLDLAGFDADFHDYDWRRPIADLGQEFAAFLNRQKEPVIIAAHSMGGIVTRAALKAGVAKGKVDRFIMIGTPNHGSFVPAQAFRGVYPFLKTLALTFDRDLTTVTEEVFSSFAGLYDLLAATETFPKFALFDPKKWPTSRPRARADLIERGASAQSLLAPIEQMQELIAKTSHLICGVNQDTIVDIEVEDGEFVFLQNKDGDGTVPRISAELKGCPTLYIDGSHGMLPNYGSVCDLTVDLAREGKTSRETLVWHAPVGPLERVREGSLRAVVARVEGLTRGEEPSPAVVRSILEPILGLPPLEAGAPVPVVRPGIGPGGEGTPMEEPVVPPVTAVTVVPVKVTSGPLFAEGLKGIVVGRHRQRQLEVSLFPGSLTSVPSRAYLLALFQGVAPAGAALAVDQLMGGVIADLVQRRMLSGRLGEIFIVPKGRSFILADHVIFVGLGPFDRFKKSLGPEGEQGGVGELDSMRVVCESVVRTCLHANVEEFATILLGSSAADDTRDALRIFTRSFLDALNVADPHRRLRKITICEMDPNRVAEIRTELLRLATTDLFEDVELELRDLPPSDFPAPQLLSRGAAWRAAGNPVYLLTRMFDPNMPTAGAGVGASGDTMEIVLETSLLLPRSKAAVLTAQRRLAPSVKEELLAKTTGGGLSSKVLARLGTDLVAFAFDEPMRGALRELMKDIRGLPLVVVHDAVSSQLPWEAFRFEDWRPALEGGISRQHLDANLSVAKWLERRAEDPILDVLLVTNPTADLPGAEEEGERIRELLSKVNNVRLTERRREQATRERLLDDFRTGDFDVVHYAGHAFFAPQNPGRSGLLCAGSEVLDGVDVAGLSNLPSLIFFNACEAGRVRGGSAAKGAEGAGAAEKKESTPADNLSVAAALIRGGVVNFLGTYWPVGDKAAEVFSGTFYPLLVSGRPIGDAVLAARREVEKQGSVDWADYILYGNPDFVLKQRTAG